MIEILVLGLVLAVGLFLLVALPLMLVGALLKLVFGLLLLPFRLLGLLFGTLAALAGGLLKGAFAVFTVLGGLALFVLVIVAFPVGILLLLVLGALGLFKLLAGAVVGATA
jgi:hypothetical protein